MNAQNKIKTMTITALLCAIGIIIPRFFPKFVLGPASFTPAIHVPIFIAMFISPTVAVSVSLITTIGFLFSGLPFVIVMRALSHIFFAFIGAWLLKKHNTSPLSFNKTILYALFIAILHAIPEVFVATYFYFATPDSYSQSYTYIVLGFVGLGTLIHSMVDFFIAAYVWSRLQQVLPIPANAKLKLRS